MPSGRTHDAITILLAVPACVAVYSFTGNTASASIVTLAFVFGGLMFGPDLDTVSRPYARWSFLRVLWVPYRHFFKHRSRFSHGLVLGALIRVVYFLGVISIIALAILTALGIFSQRGGDPLAFIAGSWRSVGTFIRQHLGVEFPALVFVGLWLGAASHTLTDLAGTFVKTGRREKFF